MLEADELSFYGENELRKTRMNRWTIYKKAKEVCEKKSIQDEKYSEYQNTLL